jgi:predicted RNA binding protein YcfA (HicA-like mRNA interferase family)
VVKISPVHYRQLVKIFEKEGWRYIRIKGSHLVFEKPGFLRPVIIPKYRQVPVFVIKNNLRTANISKEKYLKLLKEV